MANIPLLEQEKIQEVGKGEQLYIAALLLERSKVKNKGEEKNE